MGTSEGLQFYHVPRRRGRYGQDRLGLDLGSDSGFSEQLPVPDPQPEEEGRFASPGEGGEAEAKADHS